MGSHSHPSLQETKLQCCFTEVLYTIVLYKNVALVYHLIITLFFHVVTQVTAIVLILKCQK